MMATLKPCTPFPVSPLFSSQNNITHNTSCFKQIPSTLTAFPSFRCSASHPTAENAIVVADRLNNPASPWLMLPSEVDETTGQKLDCFYSLADGNILRLNRKKSLKVPDTAKCIASTMGWLGFVDTKDCSVYLSNPFLNDVVELPSLATLPSALAVQRDPRTNEILKFKVCSTDYDTIWGSHDYDHYHMVEPENMAWHISHLALSRADPRSCDTLVMAIQGNCVRRLAYCPISRKFTQDTDFDGFESDFDPNCWTGLQEDYYPGRPYNQVVYDDCRDLFYTMFDNIGIQAYDLLRHRGRRSKMVFDFSEKNLELELKAAFDKQGLGKRWKRRYYLVTLQNGDLLLIVRHYEIIKEYSSSHKNIDPHKTHQFDVFRVVSPGFLERVTRLDNDRAIFIGWNQSFCIKASSSPGVSPNCIYFTDDISSCEDYNVHPDSQWGHDTGIYRMEDGAISSCYPYLDKDEEMKVPIPAPLFWVAPLPSYVWYMAREHGIDDEKLSVVA